MASSKGASQQAHSCARCDRFTARCTGALHLAHLPHLILVLGCVSWRWSPARAWGRTRSSARSAPAAWARSIAPATSRLGRDVAIKVLPAETAKIPDRLARFEREARAVAALNHPNILALHDIGNDAGIVYAVMELLEGETLRDRLAAAAARSPRKAIDYAIQIARGLAAAHERGSSIAT